jgi:membrane AbrB-like protein
MPAFQFSASAIFRILLTLAIAACGGGVAMLLGLPAGWLMGGALAVTIATLLGAPTSMPDWLKNVTFVLIGMSMGASVAPDSLSLLGNWPISLAALAVELVIIVAATGWMLIRFFKLDAGTAYLGSFPGHLSFVMGMAATGVGNPRQIVVIQVIRVLMLTIAVPIGTVFLPIDHFVTQAATAFLSPLQLLLLALGCVALGLVFMRLKIPAGLVLGAMAAATGAKLGGLYTEAMPPMLVLATFVLTGALIGSRFKGVTRQELTAAALGGLIATIMTMAIVTLMALGVTPLVGMPFGQVWLALSPGALEGMGALGIALGYDTAFIAAHHVIRLLMLTFAVPLVVMLIRWGERRDGLGSSPPRGEN